MENIDAQIAARATAAQLNERAAAPAGERAGAVGDCDGVAGCFDCRAPRRGVNGHCRHFVLLVSSWWVLTTD